MRFSNIRVYQKPKKKKRKETKMKVNAQLTNTLSNCLF